MKKNTNTAKNASINAQQISEALKKSTQKSLQDMLNEAISNTLMEAEDESCKEEDVDDNDTEDSYDVEDVDTENGNDEETERNCDDDECENGECDTEDDMSDFEDYKVGDNDYDFTGVDGDEVLKVYNKLGDDDQIIVKKDEDGNYELKDNETGAEYVIELGDADNSAEFEDDTDDFDDEGDTEFELDMDGEDEGDDFDDEGDTEFELDMDGEDEGDDFDDEEGNEDIDIEFDDEDGDDEGIDIEINDEDNDDDEILNEEDLGYTTNYQKDVMPGLNMSEPADNSTTNDWDAGVPKGNSRPYSGFKNKESNLFTKKVNETATLRARTQTKRAGGKNTTPREHNKPEYSGEVRHDVSDSVNEGQLKRLVATAKKIQAENKGYKQAINGIKKSLYEAAVLNVTLGQVVKLLSENTTTKAEKASIVERFNKVKSINEAKSLYDTVSRELNESKKGGVLLDRGYSATNRETLNETTLYQNNPAIKMMDRMDSLDKLWGENKK